MYGVYAAGLRTAREKTEGGFYMRKVASLLSFLLSRSGGTGGGRGVHVRRIPLNVLFKKRGLNPLVTPQ